MAYRSVYPALVVAALAGCDERGPYVQPSMTRLEATATLGSGTIGSFELNLYLPPEASEASDVLLHTLTTWIPPDRQPQLSFAEMFPVTVEPGERVTIPIGFQLTMVACPTLVLKGSIYDERQEVLGFFSSVDLSPSGC